jgi:DNA-binding MarR family transcriptional regulator
VAGHLLGERWTRYVTKSFGLTPAGAAVVMAIHRNPELNHGELAGACLIRPATLTGVVDTLIRTGFVTRQADVSDRRSVRIVLTAKGNQVATRVARRVAARKSLTSVDADPGNEEIVRRFLIELITELSVAKEPA